MEQNPLLMESGLQWLTKKAREYCYPLLSALICGLLAYGFFFTNKLVNHDEVNTLFGKGGTLELGRWGLKFATAIFPNYSMPWIYGILTVSLIAVSTCVMVHIFHIRSKLLQVLLAGTVAVFPSLTATMAYMFTVAPYALAFLLAVVTVQLLQQPKKWQILLAVVLMVASLSLYQAYISITAGLLLLVLVQRLLEQEPVPQVFRRGLWYLLFLAVSVGLYFVLTQILMAVKGSGFSSYADDSLSINLAEIPKNILLAYQSFFQFFTEGFHGIMPTPFSRVIHWILLVGILMGLLLWILSQNKIAWDRLFLLALALCLLPLAINCMRLFTTDSAFHTLILYGFISFYILAVILAETCCRLSRTSRSRRVVPEVITLSLAMVLAANIYLANVVSLNLHLRYENTYGFYTALIADLQQMPSFNQNTKLALVGDYHSPTYYYVQFKDLESITGVTGFLPSDYSKERFMEFYMGFPVSFADDEEMATLQQLSQVQQMPCYPYYGSMQFIGDILVVKLS